MNAIHEIKFGPRFTARIGVAAGLVVGLYFALLGGTAFGYAIVGTVIAMANLSGIFGVIV